MDSKSPELNDLRVRRCLPNSILFVLALMGFQGLPSLPYLPCATAAETSGSANLSPPSAGLRVMGDLTQGNCTSCHVVPGLTGVQGRFGPSLEGVATRWSPQQLRQWVFDARVLRPNTLMPPFGTLEGLNSPWPKQPILSAEQIDLVVRTLETFR